MNRLAPHALDRYQLLLGELHTVQSRRLPPAIEAACQHQSAERYARWMQEELQTYHFLDRAEEVYLHKEILVLFLVEVEYARLLHYAHIFCEDHASAKEKKAFWLKQISRLANFKTRYRLFWEYLSSGSLALDDLHYARDSTDSYVQLKSWLMARERYQAYAEKQLAALD
jgi:hypothetical protein